MIIIDNGLKTVLVRKLAAVSAGITAFICSGLYFDWNKSEWASWVQAVGSIAAILGAYSLANRQRNEAERLRRLDRLEREFQYARAVTNLSQETQRCLRDIARKFEARSNHAARAIDTVRLSELAKSLSGFANKDIDPFLLAELLVLQREVAYTITACAELGSHIASPERIANAKERKASVDEADRRMLEFAQKLERRLRNETNAE